MSDERVSCAASPYSPVNTQGAVAQLGERLHGMQEVVGSSPIGSIAEPASCGFSSFLALMHSLRIRSGLIWNGLAAVVSTVFVAAETSFSPI